MDFEQVYTDSECFQTDEDKMEFNNSIFNIYNEVIIHKDGNCLMKTWAIGDYEDEDYHLIIREILWDYILVNSSRFEEFIQHGVKDYVIKMMKPWVWGENIFKK